MTSPVNGEGAISPLPELHCLPGSQTSCPVKELKLCVQNCDWFLFFYRLFLLGQNIETLANWECLSFKT